jgi:hypothetical protein
MIERLVELYASWGAAWWRRYKSEVSPRGWQTEPLPRTELFDDFAGHASVLPLLRRLMGPAMRSRP